MKLRQFLLSKHATLDEDMDIFIQQNKLSDVYFWKYTLGHQGVILMRYEKFCNKLNQGDDRWV